MASPHSAPAATARPGPSAASAASSRSIPHHSRTMNTVSDQKCTENQTSSGYSAATAAAHRPARGEKARAPARPTAGTRSAPSAACVQRAVSNVPVRP